MVARSRTGGGVPVGTARYPIQSVANAARILSMVSKTRHLKLSDIADVLDVSPSTAHRLLTTLQASGLLRQNTASLLYESGDDLLALAHALSPRPPLPLESRPTIHGRTERKSTVHRNLDDPQ